MRESRRGQRQKRAIRKRHGETVNRGGQTERQRKRTETQQRRRGLEPRRHGHRGRRGAESGTGTGPGGQGTAESGRPLSGSPHPAAALTSLARPAAPGVSTALPLLRPPLGRPQARLGSPLGVPSCALLLPCAPLVAVRSRCSAGGGRGGGTQEGQGGRRQSGRGPGGLCGSQPPNRCLPPSIEPDSGGALESCPESCKGE